MTAVLGPPPPPTQSVGRGQHTVNTINFCTVNIFTEECSNTEITSLNLDHPEIDRSDLEMHQYSMAQNVYTSQGREI